MNPAELFRRLFPDAQFGIAALLEFTTLCAILAALSSLIGLGACFALMAMALMLAAGRGFAALVVLIVALFATEWVWTATPAAPRNDDASYGRFLLTIGTAAAICLWYRVRATRQRAERASDAR